MFSCENCTLVGKSTTLMWMLSTFDPSKHNISTLEDPVEYFLPWVNQSQVQPDIGYDFPEWLRTLVRQDPDIIMVWEIRDNITAKLAINAAITGHLVFSTVHANSASSTIQRLINMDVDNFLITSAVNLILSQRLVRTICPHCKEPFAPDSKTLEKVKKSLKNVPWVDINNLQFSKWKWCDKCKWQWYKWRMAIYELLEITEEIIDVIVEQHWIADDIQEVAVKQWMITIEQNWFLAALWWKTTLEEVLIASDAM